MPSKYFPNPNQEDKFIQDSVKSDLLSVKLGVLSDTEKLVGETMTMQMSPQKALTYLQDSGINMSRSTYFRARRKVEAKKWERLTYVPKNFTNQHLDRMNKLELVEQLMWKEYQLEKSPFRRVSVLSSIVQMQPYLSGYYDASLYVLSKRLLNDNIMKPELGYIELEKFNKDRHEKDEQKYQFNYQEQKELKDSLSRL